MTPLTALLIVLYAVLLTATVLLILEHRATQRFPSYARAWARVFGEPEEPPSHVHILRQREGDEP